MTYGTYGKQLTTLRMSIFVKIRTAGYHLYDLAEESIVMMPVGRRSTEYV